MTPGVSVKRFIALALALGLAVAGLVAAGAGPALANPSNCSYGDPPAPSPRIVKAKLDGLDFNVLLPSDYASSTRRYPVLYLLHALDYNENTWLSQSDLVQFTQPFSGADAAIVVTPDGGPQGFYTDWYQGNEQWETYHLRRLVPYVDAHFRTLADRAHRAVAGFSMGGFGAMHYAARHPDMFAAVGSFSGINDMTIPEAPYSGPPSVERRSGTGSPGPAYGGRPPRPYRPPDDAGSGCGPSSGSDFGDRVQDAVVWHGHNPTDLAENLAGLAVYVYAGSGVPCVPDDLTGPPSIASPLEPGALEMNRRFDAALSAAHVPHTTDFRACGIHNMPTAARGLRAFWPIMVRAFGRRSPTAIAHYRSIDPDFSLWGWTFHADPKRALEFLEIENAGGGGLTLTGSGTETVQTPPAYRPRARYRIRGAAPARATATRDGRLTLRVDLGPTHTQKQFSGSKAPFVSRAVTIRRMPAARRKHSARRHRRVHHSVRFTG